MIVLGIETTCDETAAAVVERFEDGRGKILSNIVLSQVERARGLRRRGAGDRRPRPCRGARPHHRQGHGAGRLRLSTRIDGIAAAAGPGLIGGVIVGLTTAKAIALVQRQAADRGQSSGSPCAHRAADRRHAVSLLPVPRLRRPHPDRRRARRRRLCALGTTQDDAIGEAFDKTAKLLGLGYPGGPQVEKEAARGDAARFALPRPMHGRKDADFSLSGLEDRAAAGSREDRAAVRPGRRRSVRLVPAGGGRRGARPAARRLAPVPRAIRRAHRAGRRRRRRRQPGDPQGAASPRLRGRHRAGGAAARAVHRQRRHDRLGRRRAAGARPDRHARRRAARALAARRDRRGRRRSCNARRRTNDASRPHRRARRRRLGNGAGA